MGLDSITTLKCWCVVDKSEITEHFLFLLLRLKWVSVLRSRRTILSLTKPLDRYIDDDIITGIHFMLHVKK